MRIFHDDLLVTCYSQLHLMKSLFSEYVTITFSSVVDDGLEGLSLCCLNMRGNLLK